MKILIYLFTALNMTLIFPFITMGKEYKGAEIYSTESWQYGKMEMRMRMAKGSGLLSTFFTYKNGSEQSGTFWEEIDIEVLGKNNAETIQTNIITGDPRQTSEEFHKPGFSLAAGYHTYTLEWTPDYIAWYLDGTEIRRSTGGQVSDLTNPQSFRFNIWAAIWEEWVGPFDKSALPAYQYVNWMAYSSYTPGSGNNGTDFTYQWSDNFNIFNENRWSKANWTFDGNMVEFVPENVVVQDGYLVLALTTEGETGFTGTIPEDYKEPVYKKPRKPKKDKKAPKSTEGSIKTDLQLYASEAGSGENITSLNVLNRKRQKHPNILYFSEVLSHRRKKVPEVIG